MHVPDNILPQPEYLLCLEQIKQQRGTLQVLVGVTVAVTTVWMMIFGGLVWTVVDFGYSWSPLKWMAPIGAIIASASVMIGRRECKLRTETKRLRSRTSMFVLNKGDLNDSKSELRKLANEALGRCDTPEQTHEVLVAYHAAALKLMELDVSSVDATQNEALEDFEGCRNELRRIHDKVGGERELKLM